jgi:hypothetical protein
MNKLKGAVSHHDAEVAELRADRDLAVEYLKAAMESLDNPDDRAAGLLALRTVAEAYAGWARWLRKPASAARRCIARCRPRAIRRSRHCWRCSGRWGCACLSRPIARHMPEGQVDETASEALLSEAALAREWINDGRQATRPCRSRELTPCCWPVWAAVCRWCRLRAGFGPHFVLAASGCGAIKCMLMCTSANGHTTPEWATEHGVPLRSLASWCAHAGRRQARLDGVNLPVVPKPVGFVAARLPAASAAGSVRIELQTGTTAVALHWPTTHNTLELAAWLQALGWAGVAAQRIALSAACARKPERVR